MTVIVAEPDEGSARKVRLKDTKTISSRSFSADAPGSMSRASSVLMPIIGNSPTRA
jgi:hypothetical protein